MWTLSTIGMILIAAWAAIGIVSPFLSYIFDRIKGTKDSDALIGSGRYEVRSTDLNVSIYTLPLLGLGVILNWIGQYI